MRVKIDLRFGGNIEQTSKAEVEPSIWEGSSHLVYIKPDDYDRLVTDLCGAPEAVLLPGRKRFRKAWRQPGFIDKFGELFVMLYVR